jgi:hypothetical protein
MATTFRMEEVACELCGADNATPVITTRDYWHGVAGRFTFVRCNDCGLIYLNPRPTEDTIGHAYPAEYYSYSADVTPSDPEVSAAFASLARLAQARNLGAAIRVVARRTDGTRGRTADRPGVVEAAPAPVRDRTVSVDDAGMRNAA